VEEETDKRLKDSLKRRIDNVENEKNPFYKPD
jgi:hypothetical protein